MRKWPRGSFFGESSYLFISFVGVWFYFIGHSLLFLYFATELALYHTHVTKSLSLSAKAKSNRDIHICANQCQCCDMQTDAATELKQQKTPRPHTLRHAHVSSAAFIGVNTAPRRLRIASVESQASLHPAPATHLRQKRLSTNPSLFRVAGAGWRLA